MSFVIKTHCTTFLVNGNHNKKHAGKCNNFHSIDSNYCWHALGFITNYIN